MKNIGIVAFTLVTLLIGIYALPQISVELGDTRVSTPNLDTHAIFENDSDVGNLKQSGGLFNSTLYTIAINNTESEEEFESTVAIIQARIQAAGLYDVSAIGYYNSENSFVEITIPGYYKDKAIIVEWLTKQGKFEFINVNTRTSAETISALKSENIESGLVQKYDVNYKDHLEFTFNDTGFETYQSLVLGGQSATALEIDDTELFYLFPVQDQQSETIAIQPQIKLIYSVEGLSPQQSRLINTLASALFETKELQSETQIETEVAIAPDFAEHGASIYGLVAVLVLFSVLAEIYLMTNARISFIMGLSTVFISSTAITILKIVAASASIGMVIGGLVFVIPLLIVVFDMLQDQDDYIARRRKVMYIAIAFVVVSLVILPYAVEIQFLADALGSIIALLFALIVYLAYPFTVVKDWLYEK